MGKYHANHTIHHDGDMIPHGKVVELDDAAVAHLVERGHLRKAHADEEVSHVHKPKPAKDGASADTRGNGKNARNDKDR